LDEGVLSDDSGIRLTEDGPKLSFGRVNNRAIEMPLPVVSAAALRNHFAAAKNFDTWRLDFATFDDLPSDAINRKATAERERTVFNTNPLGKIPTDLFEPRRFSKSSIVLSENATFDDLNTAFSGGYDEVEETPFILSFSPLSGSKTTIRRILIDEYFLREKVFYAINEFEPNTLNGIRERERSLVFECDFNVISGAERNRFVAAEYKGSDIWQDQKYFDVPWNRQSFFTKMA
jgi:hypothetical protein